MNKTPTLVLILFAFETKQNSGGDSAVINTSGNPGFIRVVLQDISIFCKIIVKLKSSHDQFDPQKTIVTAL